MLSGTPKTVADPASYPRSELSSPPKEPSGDRGGHGLSPSALSPPRCDPDTHIVPDLSASLGGVVFDGRLSTGAPGPGDVPGGDPLGVDDMAAIAAELRLTTPKMDPDCTTAARRPSNDRISLYLQLLTSQGSEGDTTPDAALHDLTQTLSTPSGRRISFCAGSKRPRAPSGTEEEYREVIRQLGLEGSAAALSGLATGASAGRRPSAPISQQRQRLRAGSISQATMARLHFGAVDTDADAMPVSAPPSPPEVPAAAGPAATPPAMDPGPEDFQDVLTGGAALAAASAGGLQWASGVLDLAEHPAQQGRFRYAKEKRRTALPGRSPRSVPAVEISRRWRSRVPDGCQVTATVVSRHTNPHSGLPLPHWHHFDDATAEQTTVPLEDGRAEFPSLVVIRGDRAAHEASCADADGAGRAYPYSSDDQQVIRILFTVRFTDPSGQMFLAHAVTEPIYSSELKITEVSHHRVSAAGGTDVIVLTSKVKKATAYIKLTDPSPPGWMLGDDGARATSRKAGPIARLPSGKPTTPDGWSLDEHNRPTCLIQPSYVHYQCSLNVRIPPYWDRGLAVPHAVEVRLVDTSQGLESAPFVLEYAPPGTCTL
mmetsp:Transcript_13383/g.40148  ORF Transcript_13383/g.40148 Transcript_13383/m.40148 type:complete len:599 (+) Transcript_13383:121-1917(+)|eukprot:CAMPEP_0182928384 /NCGR_PEP_ID=MMETSP0105_2-20130417/15558_1 /TAXON_ID=81532 ORGANISM="Acanthoeca-like sp., Strain 10tr" /NCGR_SAMPLE_ID=MMETSP0105_2 /ASSEMBLY_ACC=CAM_ASM_000205 /LENGTH=598 /DNA_ID=CAMNT_0025066387 /DNA_START=189 /DNA_END=1985 /DNA_ORIENTATION=+